MNFRFWRRKMMITMEMNELISSFDLAGNHSQSLAAAAAAAMMQLLEKHLCDRVAGLNLARASERAKQTKLDFRRQSSWPQPATKRRLSTQLMQEAMCKLKESIITKPIWHQENLSRIFLFLCNLRQAADQFGCFG